MHSAWSRARFAGSRVARLATADALGRPHLVPIVFAVVGDVIATAVDLKPKSTPALRRLDDIRANPAVSVLVDQYDDDWTQLWWARADGDAEVRDASDPGVTEALAALVSRYQPYQAAPPPGPVIQIMVRRWSGWSAAG